MQAPSGLASRVGRAFLLQAAFISVAVILSIFFAKVVLDEILIKEAIEQEADYFIEARSRDASFPLPDTSNLTAYMDRAELPADFATETDLAPGFHQHDDSGHILFVSDMGTDKLYLLYYRGQVDALAAYYGLVPLALVFILLYVALWITYRFSHRLVSPISRLANEVNQIDLADIEKASLRLDELPADSNEEIRVLAESIEHLFERLQQFIERERNFTRDASHELRSPLTVIKIAADMLRTEQDLSRVAQQSVTKILRAVDDMGDLTEAFLLLARESDNALSVDRVAVNEVVREEIERARLVAGKESVEVRLTENSELAISGSDKVVSVLLGNLVRNAMLYTRQGSVDVIVERDKVIIHDTGVGITADQLEKIFSPHFRASGTTAVGHGVGLTIVKRLSDRFNWPLTISSEPGKGTWVEVGFTPLAD